MGAIGLALTAPLATFVLALIMRRWVHEAEVERQEIHVLVNSQMSEALARVEEQDAKIEHLEGVIAGLQEAKVAAVAVAEAVQAVQEVQASAQEPPEG